MITIKNERELDLMRQACKITAAARALAGEMVRPGMTTKQIDKAVYEFIVSQGAKPSFLHYNGYPASVCISVNDTIIHGIPGHYVLREGDIVSNLPLRADQPRSAEADRCDPPELLRRAQTGHLRTPGVRHLPRRANVCGV